MWQELLGIAVVFISHLQCEMATKCQSIVRGEDGYPGECVFKVCFCLKSVPCPGISASAWLSNSSTLCNLEVLEGVGSLQETGISGAFKLLCQL